MSSRHSLVDAWIVVAKVVELAGGAGGATIANQRMNPRFSNVELRFNES